MPNEKLTVYGTISPPSYAEDILANLTEGIAVFDSDSCIQVVNPAFLKML